MSAWNAAADTPTSTTSVLCDPPERAGYHLVSGEELAEVSEYEPEEGVEEKAKEQKQITMAVEEVTARKLRGEMAALDPGTQKNPNMLCAAFFSVGPSSRHWIYTPPYKGCDLTSAEMRVIIDRYFGVTCKTCAPHVGRPVRGETAGPRGAVLDKYGITLANANVGGDRWRRRHDAVLSVIMSELASADHDAQDNVYTGSWRHTSVTARRTRCSACAVGRTRGAAKATGSGGGGRELCRTYCSRAR